MRLELYFVGLTKTLSGFRPVKAYDKNTKKWVTPKQIVAHARHSLVIGKTPKDMGQKDLESINHYIAKINDKLPLDRQLRWPK